MKKILFILSFFPIFSCSNQGADNFVGKWVDKKNEKEVNEIVKNGNNYLAIDERGKYPAEYNDGMLDISSPYGIVKAIIDKESGNLIVGGKEYIKFESATRQKFIGEWVVSEALDKDDIDFNDVILRIEIDQNNNFVIYKDNGKRLYDYSFQNGKIYLTFSNSQVYTLSPIEDIRLELKDVNNPNEYFILSKKEQSSN